MKQETKKKLCKISKIVGFVITFGFAVFGALCAAMLIGNGSKKDDIKTLDISLVQNEIRTKRIEEPRKAPDYQNSYNYIDNGTRLDVYYNPYGSSGASFESENGGYSVYFRPQDLPSGYYYLAGMSSDEYTAGMWGPKNHLSDILAVEWESGVPKSKVTFLEGYSMPFNGNSPFYCYINWEGHENDLLWFRYPFKLYLVDTLEVLAKNVVNFPSNWSPMALISDNLSIKGGYAFVDVSPATYQTLVPITISLKQNLFRYDGKVYDEMVFTFVDLSHGDGYIQDDGQPWKPWEKSTSQLSSSLHVFGLYSLRFNSSFNGESIVALSPIYSDSPFQTGGDGTYYPPTVYLPTGEYRWVNPKVTYIEFIDTSFGSGSSRYDGRYSDYEDLDLLIFLNGFLSEGNYLSVGASGGVFDLMSGAFNGLLPILNVQVLPNITLGILLFLPLIGAIIVIIIRVVKK